MSSVDHALPRAYPRDARLAPDGSLHLGGVDARELAAEFGTPAYVVLEDDLRAGARAFVAAGRATGADVGFHFAAKSFPSAPIMAVLREEGIGCDVAGLGELHAALRAGFDPADVLLHGNAKTRPELEFAVERGIGLVVVDNLDEVARLAEVVARAGREQAVLLRVAPGVSPDTHPSISTGGPNTKFGLSLPDAARALELLERTPGLRVEGLHFHIGSQILELDPFREALERVVDALGRDFRTWDLGGGLGVAYTDEEPPAVDDYVAAKVAMVSELVGPGRRILDEPGRALTARCAVTLYEVQSVKENVATWVAVDGGMSDNLRPMLYGAKYEALVLGKPADAPRVRAHLTGRHCESGDVLIHDALLADPQVGDVVVTPATGAYGHAMANNYNGSLRPPVVLVAGGRARLAVRRETYEDLFARDVA